MKYKIKNEQTNETLELTIKEILDYVNSDRSEKWTNYDESDWIEGLEHWTDFRVIGNLWSTK